MRACGALCLLAVCLGAAVEPAPLASFLGLKPSYRSSDEIEFEVLVGGSKRVSVGVAPEAVIEGRWREIDYSILNETLMKASPGYYAKPGDRVKFRWVPAARARAFARYGAGPYRLVAQIHDPDAVDHRISIDVPSSPFEVTQDPTP